MSATPFGQFWPASWTTDPVLNGASVAGGANSSNSGAIANSAASPNEVLGTECDIEVGYGATVTGGGVTVYVCRQTKNSYESAVNDAPYGFALPAVASTTIKRVFTISGDDVANFQVVVSNPPGNSSVTVTLYYRQSQGQSG